MKTQKTRKHLLPRISHSPFLQFISLFVLISFTSVNLILTPSYADEMSPLPIAIQTFPNDLSLIHLPQSIGKTQEFHQGKDKQVVILIQDAHAIPDAQRNIQKIIDHFQKEYGVGLIALEGTSSELDPQIFKSFPDQEKLKKTFEEYFEKGELTGVTAAAIFNESQALYHGIEDWSLYEEGLGLYLKALKEEQKINEELQSRKTSLEKQKEKVYSKELLKVDEIIHHFHENQSNLIETLQKLFQIKAPREGTELSLLLEEAGKADESEFSIEQEVKKMAGEVKKAASSSRSDLMVFNQKFQEYQTSRITPEAFAHFMMGLVAKFDLPIRPSSHLAYLIENQKKMKEIEGTQFFKDFEAYTNAVKASLIKTEDERRLDQQTRRLELLDRLAHLELTREDWQELTFTICHSERSEESATLDPSASPQDDSVCQLPSVARNEIKTFFSHHFAFYRNAQKREEVFYQNLTSLMKKEGSTSSILVAGGFHSEGMIKKLKENDISYILLTPQINSIPEHSFYKEHMQGEVSWKDYFQVEDGKVNLSKAFIRGTRDKLLDASQDTLHSSLLLKEWRDQIIRDLAQDERITELKQYTPFLDELIQRKEHRPDWMMKVERFIDGLRKLDAQKQLTEPNIMKLLGPATMADLTAGAIARDTRVDLSRVPLSIKLAMKASPETLSEAGNVTKPRAKSKATARAEVRGLKTTPRLRVEQLEDRIALHASSDTNFLNPQFDWQTQSNMSDHVIAQPISGDGYSSTTSPAVFDEFEGSLTTDQTYVVNRLTQTPVAHIGPSPNLTPADITLLPEREDGLLLPTSGLIASRRTSQIFISPTSRGVAIGYATGPTPGWAGGGWFYDHWATPEIETGDLRQFSELVFGMKGDSTEAILGNNSDDVFFEIVDAYNHRATVQLTGIDSDQEHVWAIPTSLFQGVDLSLVHHLGFYVTGEFKFGWLDVYREPFPVSSVEGLESQYLPGQTVSLQLHFPDSESSSSVRLKEFNLLTWGESGLMKERVSSAQYSFENGIFTWRIPVNAWPGEYQLEFEDISNPRINISDDEDNILQIPIHVVPPLNELGSYIENTRLLFESLFGIGEVQLPPVSSGEWQIDIAETLDSKLNRIWFLYLTGKALRLRAPIVVQGQSATVEISVDPSTRRILDQIIWVNDDTGMGIVSRSELIFNFSGAFLSRTGPRFLYGLVDGLPEFQEVYNTFNPEQLLTLGTALWHELTEGEQKLYLITYGHEHQAGPLTLVANGLDSDIPHSVFHIAVQAIEDTLNHLAPDIIQRLYEVNPIMIITQFFEDIPEFNQLDIPRTAPILGLWFTPYAGPMARVGAARWTGNIADTLHDMGQSLYNFVHTVVHEFGHTRDLLGIPGAQRSQAYDRAKQALFVEGLYQGTYAGSGLPWEFVAEMLTAGDDAGSYFRHLDNPNFAYTKARLFQYDPETLRVIGNIFGVPGEDPTHPTLNPDMATVEDIARLLEVALSQARPETDITVRVIPGTARNKLDRTGETGGVFEIIIPGFEPLIVSADSRNVDNDYENGFELIISTTEDSIRIFRGFIKEAGEAGPTHLN